MSISAPILRRKLYDSALVVEGAFIFDVQTEGGVEVKQEGNLLGGLRYLSILMLSDNITSILV